MRVIWQDQAEYYFVCEKCFAANAYKQWSGSTRVRNWDRQRARVMAEAVRLGDNAECEFCGPNGNGGFAE
jgi:hypothetical protein